MAIHCCKSQVHKAKTELDRGHGEMKVPLGSPWELSIYCQQGGKTLSPIWVTCCLLDFHIFPPFHLIIPVQQNRLPSF